MFNGYKDKNRRWPKTNFQAQNSASGFTAACELTPAQVVELVQRGELRFADNPGNMRLAYLTTVISEDAYLQDLFGHVLDKQAAQAMVAMASDAFWPNYPPAGSVVIQPNMTFCGFMPTGDPIVFVDSRVSCNLGVFGRTGASKTCFNYVIIWQLIKKGYTVVVFQQKNEYDDWATDPELEGKVLPLRYSDFKIALGQAARGVNQRHHIYMLSDNLSRSYSRLYAQRFGEDVLMARSKSLPAGMHLPLSLFIEAVEKYRPGRGGVEARYKESMLYTLKDIKNCFGDIFDYYCSDFMDRLFEFKGLITITVDVPIAGSTFFITHAIQHEYERRKSSSEEPDSFQPIVFLVEDATILTDERELEGMSPLVPMTFLARRYRMGFIYCGHTISGAASQKLISNLESIFIFGISGEDQRRIQTLLGCTEAQAQMAQLLKPGQFLALIPSFSPKPVSGRFPYIKPPRKLCSKKNKNDKQPISIMFTQPGNPDIELIGILSLRFILACTNGR